MNKLIIASLLLIGTLGLNAAKASAVSNNGCYTQYFGTNFQFGYRGYDLYYGVWHVNNCGTSGTYFTIYA